MRELLNDDLFLISEILDKMDINIPDIRDKTGAEKSDKTYGMEIIMSVVKNIHLAKDQVNTLISNLTGKTKEEAAVMKLSETVKTIKEIIAKEDFKSFF